MAAVQAGDAPLRVLFEFGGVDHQRHGARVADVEGAQPQLGPDGRLDTVRRRQHEPTADQRRRTVQL